MTERELIAALEAVVAPLIEEVQDLRVELRAYTETFGERTLSLAQVAEMAGKSKRTVHRRVEVGKLRVIPGVTPYRVLFSEYLRATREGDL